MLTEKDINRSIATQTVCGLPPFIICISHQRDLITGEKIKTYAIVAGTDNKNVKEVTRAQAKNLIDIAGLTCVLENRHGKIYDSPNQTFRTKFKHRKVMID